MKTGRIVLGIGWLLVLAGCAKTHISVLNTRREELSSQSKVFAVATRNLEETVHRNLAGAAEEEAARAIAALHDEAESFARIAGAWRTDDQVNAQYETLVEVWVKVRHAYPQLKPDSLTHEAYQRVEYEWEQLDRAAGYAARKYQRETEEQYGGK